jgi:hypothetical protein
VAFGFPAYHTEVFSEIARAADRRELALEALDLLGWPAREESEDTITASVGVSLWSWSEKLAIRILPNRGLSITSKCALPTQCIDYGKNKSNVQKLISELRRLSWLRQLEHDDAAPVDSAALDDRRSSHDIQERTDRIQ